MSEHQTAFNQRVNYGKLWFKWNRGIGGGSWVKDNIRKAIKNKSLYHGYMWKYKNA